MTIKRDFGIFDMSKVLINRFVTSDHVRKAFAGINYMYEAIGGEAVPNGGTQEVAGHDHADQGGAPITRGCIGSWFGGRNPLFLPTPSDSMAQVDSSNSPQYQIDGNPSDALGCHRTIYVSPGIDTLTRDVLLPISLRVLWPNTAVAAGDPLYNVRLRIENMDFEVSQPWLKGKLVNRVEVDIESQDGMQELTVLVPVKGDWWNRLNFYTEALGGESPYSAQLGIYDIVMHETVADSLPQSSGQLRYR